MTSKKRQYIQDTKVWPFAVSKMAQKGCKSELNREKGRTCILSLFYLLGALKQEAIVDVEISPM